MSGEIFKSIEREEQKVFNFQSLTLCQINPTLKITLVYKAENKLKFETLQISK